jgi:hypothetical protein
MHPTDIEKVADTLSGAGRHVMGVDCMDCAAVDWPETKGMVIRKVPLPLTSTPAPPTREVSEGGSNVTKSLQKAVMMIEKAEYITQKRKRSRPRAMEDGNATELKGTLTSVS